ncbi:sulfite exporter TauE/SafE family protein [Alphaproteobacteria bacterium KMM 3653]|uniref:Probable membrane transporter protein n=1 Tax=Harenicola maris TaxID=2841044 RepID=A0AAP2G6Q2_9RHOB|nr:sulfite exporter TauE/SafE family protein [Harenicola maris]
MQSLSFTEPMALAAVFFALLAGGILKGATGAGAPLLAVPVMAAVYDVRVAVAVMVLPNLLSNLWQARKYHAHHVGGGVALKLSLMGAVGAAAGTVLLAWLPVSILQIFMAVVITGYIALRLLKPAMALSMPMASRLAAVAGFFAGVLQGAAGISAPIAVTFLSAMKLQRVQFIVTVACFFAAVGLAQLPVQVIYGIMTWHLSVLSLLAFAPLLMGMPVGEWIGKRISPQVFDRVILILLGLLALRLVWVEVF